MTDNSCLDGHSWAPTGVYVDGVIHVPCRRKRCKAELRQVWLPTTGQGHAINGIELDIEDDPLGGVSKTICREAAHQYAEDLGLQPGDVVVDIGAHVGVISIYLAKRYPGIKVYAYEPLKANFDRLQQNITANGVEGITAYNLAVSGNGRVVQIAGNPEANSGGAGIYGSGPRVEHCLSVSLSQIFERHSIDRCALLKIDCEGAEYEILQTDETLLDRIDNLRGEFHTNSRLVAERKTIDGLRALCERHIKPDRVLVTSQRIGE